MKQDRLYKIQIIESDDVDDFDYDEQWDAPRNPPGWREFAISHPRIPDDADFFIPRKAFNIFRSRSSAKDKLSYFTRWGIDAEIVECTPQWESIPDANARRAWERTAQ